MKQTNYEPKSWSEITLRMKSDNFQERNKKIRFMATWIYSLPTKKKQMSTLNRDLTTTSLSIFTFLLANFVYHTTHIAWRSLINFWKVCSEKMPNMLFGETSNEKERLKHQRTSFTWLQRNLHRFSYATCYLSRNLCTALFFAVNRDVVCYNVIL